MSAAEATRFLERVEADAALSDSISGLGADHDAVYALVRAEGFDCTPDEIKHAFLEAHGDKLTAEQLDAVAGGVSEAEAIGLATMTVVVVAAAAW